MQKPRVSVIIPVYNAGETIGNILEKLTSQNYKNIEVIAINDGSRDNSLMVLRKFAKEDERIIVIDQRNKGASGARNVGIDHSSGEFITFIDSDDDIDNRLISELTDHIKKGSDFIMCGMSIGNKQIKSPNIYIDDKEKIGQYVLNSLLTKNLLYGPYCKLFRRSIIVDNHIQFPEKIKYGEDTIFVLSYLQYAANMANLQKSLYAYNFQTSTSILANSKNITFHRARVGALRSFKASYKQSLAIILGYLLVRSRWNIALAKNMTRRLNA